MTCPQCQGNPVTFYQIVGQTETREVEEVYDSDGKLVDLRPRPETYRVVLTIRSPDGVDHKVEVPPRAP